MKNSMLTSLALLVIGFMFLTSCQSKAVKEDKANSIVQDVKSDVIIVQQDTITTYQKFLQESEDQIKVYEKNIAELKVKIAQEEEEKQAKFEEKLAELEQRNETLKTKIISYKNEQVDNWDEKQLEFRKDLDELGSAITDFFDKDE